MAWKPEVKVAGNGGKWSQNGLVFATEREAYASAAALMNRWMLVEDCRAVEVSDDEHKVNYRMVELSPGLWRMDAVEEIGRASCRERV